MSERRNCSVIIALLISILFPTGLNRSNFDNKAVTFEHHIKREHNMWNYLYFMVLLKTKDPTEFTGSECYVSKALKV